MLADHRFEDFSPQPDTISLDRVAVIILGGGQGTRLYPLTKARCKPAVSFGGRYTLIDVPISHALLTGLNKIYVIGQHLASSLQRHLSKTYHNFLHNDVQLLVPQENTTYQGTADAVRQNIQFFSEIDADYFLILSGDQLYNINFQKMIQFGVERDASMVVAAQPVNGEDAKRMGLLKLARGESSIIDFCEKPQHDELLKQYYIDPFAMNRLGFACQDERNYLGSMGIYLFKKDSLFDLLHNDPRDDFGKHLIPTQVQKGGGHAYLYDGYWEDIGTIGSYYNANLALTKAATGKIDVLNCYDERNQIMTQNYHLPGARISGCFTNASLLCEGSLIEADEITNSVVGVRSQIKQGVVIRNSILMGNSYYEKLNVLKNGELYCPVIDEGTTISNAIIDENVSIGKNVRLMNQANLENYDAPDGKLFVRNHIVVVPSGTCIPDNYTF